MSKIGVKQAHFSEIHGISTLPRRLKFSCKRQWRVLMSCDATPQKVYCLWSPTNPMHQPKLGSGTFGAATEITPPLPEHFSRFVNPQLYRKWVVTSVDVRRIFENYGLSICDVFSTMLPCDPSNASNINSVPGFDFGGLNGQDITDWLTMNPNSMITGVGARDGAAGKTVINSHYKTCNFVGITPGEVYDHMCGTVLDDNTYVMLNGGNNAQTQYNAWFCDGIMSKYRDAIITNAGGITDAWSQSATTNNVYYTLEVVYHCVAFNDLGNEQGITEPAEEEEMADADNLFSEEDSFSGADIAKALGSLAVSKRNRTQG